MTEEVRGHAFEPFFTTKPVGKGSGLGLSMIYGFARQSGGQATISSSPGAGTTIRLYLPRAKAAPDRVDPSPPAERPEGHNATILVIEDDPQFGDVTEKLLSMLGYAVVSAHDAASARRMFAMNPEIDLVLSDVVLPGELDGSGFATELRATRPDLPIIFMSGYPAGAETRSILSEADSVLLGKPFRVSEVAAAIHAALEPSSARPR